MADVKVTFSQDTSKHAASMQEEAKWLMKYGTMITKFPGKPSRPVDGGWVYFIFKGLVAARAAIRDMTGSCG